MARPFAMQHVKTDKVDVTVLAQLLRMEYLPESSVPGEGGDEGPENARPTPSGPCSNKNLAQESRACTLDDGGSAASGGDRSLWNERTGISGDGGTPAAETGGVG